MSLENRYRGGWTSEVPDHKYSGAPAVAVSSDAYKVGKELYQKAIGANSGNVLPSAPPIREDIQGISSVGTVNSNGMKYTCPYPNQSKKTENSSRDTYNLNQQTYLPPFPYENTSSPQQYYPPRLDLQRPEQPTTYVESGSQPQTAAAAPLPPQMKYVNYQPPPRSTTYVIQRPTPRPPTYIIQQPPPAPIPISYYGDPSLYYYGIPRPYSYGRRRCYGGYGHKRKFKGPKLFKFKLFK